MISLQIKALADAGASASDIAEALELDVATVDLELVKMGRISEDDISNEDFDIIKGRLIDIAKNCPDEALASRTGMFLWEQKRGAAKLKQAPTVNVLMINQLIQSARDKVLRSVNESNQRRASGPAQEGSEGQVTTAHYSASPETEVYEEPSSAAKS